MTEARKPAAMSLRRVRPGDVFLMPLEDGRYGVCRVLRTRPEQGDVLAAASPWVGASAPALDEPQVRQILRLTHHNWQDVPYVGWMSAPVPATFTRLGDLPPTEEEAAWEEQGQGPSNWIHLPLQVFLQWRWDHEREAVLAEARQQEESTREAQEKWRRAYKPLPQPLLSELVKQTPLKSWGRFVEAEVLQEARAIVRATMRALLALGPDAATAARLDVIRECVENFNDIDDGWICTIEREDICDLLHELAARVDLDDYDEALTCWRDW
jgi:hypothetical protein